MMRTRVRPTWFFSAVCAAVMTACPAEQQQCINGDEQVCDAGVPSDNCDTKEQALSDSACQLTLGAERTDYISERSDGSQDIDWFSFDTGALTPQSLVHVRAEYAVESTPVNLSLNVLDETGTMSLASGTDNHAARAPAPVDLVFPYSKANAKVLVRLQDNGTALTHKVDNANPYIVFVETKPNPDSNEPNDTMPTSIATPDVGGVPTGSENGYLATPNDVDQFEFDAPAGQILYMHIYQKTVPSHSPNYRLTYTLFDPNKVPVAEGQMDHRFLRIELATARLITLAGKYTLVLKGLDDSTTKGTVPGDIDNQYDIDIKFFPDLDGTTNDTVMTAKAMPLNAGANTIKGHLSYVADDEWYRVTIPADATNYRVLRWSVSVAASGGRFDPLTTTPNRQFRILQEVTTGINKDDKINNCKTRADVCPRSFKSQSDRRAGLVNDLCQSSDPPQCIWHDRVEEQFIQSFKNLQNFVGSMPLAPSGTAREFLVLFRDSGAAQKKYADDREWTITLTLENDADETGRGTTPQVVNLSTTPQTVSGTWSYGYGLFYGQENLDMGFGVHGPNDYDAYDYDQDTYQFNFPAGATGDRTWELQWEIKHGTRSSPGLDLAMDITLCGGAGLDGGGGTCGTRAAFIYGATFGPYTPWYLPVVNGSQRILFTQEAGTNSTIIKATLDACTCFSAQAVNSGRYYINLIGANRTHNDPVDYTFTQAIVPYPPVGGSCGQDGGVCRFAGQ